MKCILISPDRPPIEIGIESSPPPQRIELPILDGPPVRWFDEDESRPPGATLRHEIYSLVKISDDDPPVATYLKEE